MMAKLSEKSKLRDTNLDLFRIFSMLLIVLLHSIDHSGVLEEAENSSGALYFYVRFLYMLCQVCVNCYVMLSGYYLVKAKFRLKKLVSLWMETAFYSFVLKFIFTAGGGTNVCNFVSELFCADHNRKILVYNNLCSNVSSVSVSEHSDSCNGSENTWTTEYLPVFAGIPVEFSLSFNSWD